MVPKILDEQSLKAREQEIIDTALTLIEQFGAENLTMDKLVKEVPYSKGTVYNHFSSKEDLLIAISNIALTVLSDLFAKAAKYDGSTRERMYLISFAYLIYATLHPALFATMLCAKSPTINGKSSECRMTEQEELEQRMLAPLFALIEEAVAKGDLTLPDYINIKQICFAHWTSGYGVIAMLLNASGSCSVQKEFTIEDELLNSNHLLLDGLNWSPLTHQQDYRALIKSSIEKVFTRELQQISKAGRVINF